MQNNKTLLKLALKECDKESAGRLRRYGNRDDGVTPLHLVCGYERGINNSLRSKLVNLLLDNEADIEAKTDSIGWTPLIYAAYTCNLEIVDTLLNRGALIDAPSESGETPLQTALEHRHECVAEFLIHRGANVNARDNHGMTALRSAIRSRLKRMVQLLVERGASVTAREGNHQATPLHYACGYFTLDPGSLQVEVVTFLLDRGADIEAKTKGFGYTPLHCVARWPNADIIKILLNRNANVEARSSDVNDTPLHVACWFEGGASNVEALIGGGADINSRNSNGYSPLHLAAQEYKSASVKILLDHSGPSDYSGVRHAGSIESVKCLLRHGVDINCRDSRGYTALYIAMRRGISHEMFKLLLDGGADFDDVTDYLASGINLALRSGVLEIIQTHIIKLELAKCQISPESVRKGMDRESKIRSKGSNSSEYSYTSYGRELRSGIAKEYASIRALIDGESSILLCNILSVIRDTRYTSNKALLDILKSLDSNQFPHYGPIIESRINYDQKRFALFQAARERFGEICGESRGRILPHEIIDRIISHLSIHELLIFNI